MNKPMDFELRKAFSESQTKMFETKKKIQVLDAQIALLKRASHHAHIARQEIDTLPPDTKAYKSAGRMFLLTDLSQVKSNLDEKILALNNRTTELQSNKQYLECSLKEIEENIKEMFQQEQTENKPT